MKKNVLAIAIATAALSTSAFAADAKVYGELDFGIQSVEGAADVDMVAEGSKLGVAGEAAQADGFTFGYQLEVGVATVDGANDLTVDKANVTVGGDFGAVTLGRQVDAVAGATTDLVDVFVNEQEEVVGEAVSYTAPVMGGVSVTANALVNSTTTENVDVYGVAGSVELTEGVEAVASYSLAKGAVDTDTVAFGAAYTAGPLYVAATHTTVDDGTTSADALVLAGAYTVEANTFAASYTLDKESDAAVTALEASHAFGESASVYAGYSIANTEAELAGAANTFNVGVKVTF